MEGGNEHGRVASTLHMEADNLKRLWRLGATVTYRDDDEYRLEEESVSDVQG